MMQLRYFDKAKNESVILDIDPAGDVVCVVIPETDNRPRILANVNTDAVLLSLADGQRLSMHEYDDILQEAIAANEVTIPKKE